MRTARSLPYRGLCPGGPCLGGLCPGGVSVQEGGLCPGDFPDRDPLPSEQNPGFPLGLENLENLEKWEDIFQSGKSQGILNRLEKSGKITQNTGKLWEFEINVIWYFSYILMTGVLFAKMDQVFS